MARFRFRFLLQEFDLPPGDTLLGRSPECHVTIEDPLVSRQHARIHIAGEGATVEDLGSRNGVRVNGVLTQGAMPIEHNDRIRIGTQELVFCKVPDGADQSSKKTGYLRHCGRCHTPFPEEMVACPNCGWGDKDDTTSNGLLNEKPVNWPLQLLLEVLEKALLLQRPVDAERIMERAAVQLEERVASETTHDVERFDMFFVAAARIAVLQQNARWLSWSFAILAKMGRLPPAALLEQAALLPAVVLTDARGASQELFHHLTSAPQAGWSAAEQQTLDRLEALGKEPPG